MQESLEFGPFSVKVLDLLSQVCCDGLVRTFDQFVRRGVDASDNRAILADFMEGFLKIRMTKILINSRFFTNITLVR